MSRLRVVIDDNKYIIFGFDAPCHGYFSEFYDRKTEEYQHDGSPSESIGFVRGVSKNRVIEMFEKHNAVEQARKQQPNAWTNLCLDLPC